MALWPRVQPILANFLYMPKKKVYFVIVEWSIV